MIDVRAAARGRAPYLRPWRIWFICYFILLETGTHWPRLELPGQVPATDKSIHFLAFGGLVLFLHLTGWIRWRWLTVAIGAAVASLDEWSQGIAGLGRTVSGEDLFANLCGVASAGLWIWTASPLGGIPNRVRQSRLECLLLANTGRRGFWLWLLAPTPVLAAAVYAVWLSAEQGTTRAVILSSGGFGVLWFMFVIIQGRRRVAMPFLRTRPCFACMQPVAAGDAPTGVCTTCATPWYAEQWASWDRPTMQVHRQVAVRPLLAGGVLFIVGVLGIYVFLRIGSWVPESGFLRPIVLTIAEVAQDVTRLPRAVGRVGDLTFLNLIFALMYRWYRVRLARWYDRGIRCPRCRHDLRGTPLTDDHMVVCSECGERIASATKE